MQIKQRFYLDLVDVDLAVESANEACLLHVFTISSSGIETN